LRKVLAGVGTDGEPIFSAIAEVEGTAGVGEFIIPPTDDERAAFDCLCGAQEKIDGYNAETNVWSKAIKDAAEAAGSAVPDKRRMSEIRKSLTDKKLVAALPGGFFKLAPDGSTLRE
jgi:hypothetical protein